MINGFIYVLSVTPSIPVPKQTLVKQTLDIQTLNRPNTGQIKLKTGQTMDKYKPWKGINPGQV